MSGKKFNPNKAHKLISEERKALLPPEKMIEYLDIGSSDIVADLGAGNGYFTIPIAKSTNDTVYAVDIEPKMLDMFKENAAKENIDNIHYVESDLVKIKLDDESVNKAIVSMVIHEVSSIDDTLNEIKRILKPGGQILLIEWKAIETESGPPLHERIPATDMLETIKSANFDAELIDLNPQHYAVKARIK
ncbi:class I SAM-dependent methyltransferase [Aquibacillus albus]|uniref:Ubiquinone/menaquinone biosynthesis C-methylase UbiE n=1 Tax=Aquibacillus albus TaxID=1168171 RepID=A0ABS2N564_9BACI|nr:class I SAM-dependent methyltransferase [Aquibacillus albus]MBM7573257.1 ubiquinone/menaquinone biosynthesis C-methylase UbiE [Aquibacillus albus]